MEIANSLDINARPRGMPMAAHPARRLTERELHSLTTAELLTLISHDLKELDRQWRKKRRTAPGPPAGSASDRLAELLAELEPPEDLALFHQVVCCTQSLGYFPSVALVRCPYCWVWHRPGAGAAGL